MVGNTAPRHIHDIEKPEKDYTFLPDKPKSTSVSLNDIIHNKMRFEASAFDLEAKAAINLVKYSKYGYVYLWSNNGLVANAFHRPRFKRLFVEKSAFPIFQPSAISEIYPKAQQYISEKTDTNIDLLKVKKGMVLLTISGTIGKSSFVSSTLDGNILSHDLLRISGKEQYDGGYIYTFFKTDTGQKILQSNNYGAVVEHIEPEHLQNVVIPNAPEDIKNTIHRLIETSYELRDESNELMDKAEDILYEELSLPSLDDLKVSYFRDIDNVRNFQVKLSRLNMRFDGSYHLPLIDIIEDHIKKHAKDVKKLKDPTLSQKIILPGRFKRVYVDKNNGVPFFGGKQLLELSPNCEKYLSKALHKERVAEQLLLKENCILVTRSGTIGKTNIVPKHLENWAANEHILRIFPFSSDISGYLYCWLNSEYGYSLITRNTYGAVVDEIDSNHLGDVSIPLLKNQDKQKEINSLVLKANQLRSDAYYKEQEAIRIMNEDVIGVPKN
ncbi:type I restriction enzyme S subunit [Seleniivibrio woodruffii]|uniref:Type I restriction enzyme S subunit n=2 Tax=Seleniivibrio woodruffii TaxID=1078050 RepID=A0A4R1K3U9_9BACT|nr:type I restriction enzyme S subunit [Seleniivibrio woodruffii]TVZ36756.1 type I restriction enzyme S subunit [Seleniivibrio woodruffii]